MNTFQETFSDGQGAAAEAGNGRRPTMKQVAALAGVSLATVSRVVNGGPSVSPSWPRGSTRRSKCSATATT